MSIKNNTLTILDSFGNKASPQGLEIEIDEQDYNLSVNGTVSYKPLPSGNRLLIKYHDLILHNDSINNLTIVLRNVMLLGITNCK